MKNKETAIREAIRLNIIKERKARKWTQTDLGNKLGLPKTTVSSWEQGLSSPDIDTIVALTKILDMDLYEFLGEPTPTDRPRKKSVSPKEQE